MPITFVCHGCVTDPFLSADMRTGARRICSQCGRRRQGLSLEALADRIDSAMQDHFQPDELDDGESYSEVIHREAGLELDVADAIQAHFVAATHRNLVLFHRAARVEPLARPANLEVEIDFGWWDEDQEDGDERITIRELELAPAAVEEAPPPETTVLHDDEFDWIEPPARPVDPDGRAVTLRFLPDSLATHYIMSLNYEPNDRGLHTVRLQHNPEGEMPF